MTKLPLGFFLKKKIVHFNGKINSGVNIASFWNFKRVNCQFLNFEIKIEKPLKFYELKLHFPLYIYIDHIKGSFYFV